MEKIICNYLLIALILICFSCSSENNDKPNENQQYQKIQVSNINSSIKYSALIDEIKYIPLETTDSLNLIGDVSKVVFSNNKFFILDKTHLKCVSIFNSEGMFLNKVGKLGEGVGEHTKIDDFYIDEQNGELGILSINKILIFNMDGKFKQERKLDFMATRVEKGTDFFAFEGVEYNLLKTDMEFKVISKEFPFASIYDLHLLNPFNKISGNILYRHSLSDTIYQVDRSTTTAYKIIDFGEKALSGELLQKVIKKEINRPEDKMHFIKYYYESTRFVYFNFAYKKMIHTCVYDKERNRSITFPANIENDVTFEGFIPLINGATDDYFIGIISDETVVMKSLDRSNPYIKSMLDIYAERDLQNKAYNPVLVLIKFKPIEK